MAVSAWVGFCLFDLILYVPSTFCLVEQGEDGGGGGGGRKICSEDHCLAPQGLFSEDRL